MPSLRDSLQTIANFNILNSLFCILRSMIRPMVHAKVTMVFDQNDRVESLSDGRECSPATNCVNGHR